MNKALHLFAARGYDAVGVQEIVDAVGITKPTLYHYFGSKRGLLEAMLSDYFNDLQSRLKIAAIYSGDLPLTLQRVAEVYFDFARQNPAFYRLQLGLWFAPRDCEGYLAVTSLIQFQFELIETIFLQAVQDHGNMRGRHPTYALTFLGMINNYIALTLNGLGELNAEVAHKAVHQFQHGIYS